MNESAAKPAAEKLRFVYLMYTDGGNFGKELLGVYGSNKDAKSHFDLIAGEVVPIGRSNRVMQKIQTSTGQYWYVEKTVIKSDR